jgi:hypothetical protein
LNLFGFYPRIQTIDHRSQWAPGVRLWRPEIAGSRFDLHGGAFWSFGGFQFYDLQAGVIPHTGRPRELERASTRLSTVNGRQSTTVRKA